jgi:hypothetical protein
MSCRHKTCQRAADLPSLVNDPQIPAGIFPDSGHQAQPVVAFVDVETTGIPGVALHVAGTGTTEAVGPDASIQWTLLPSRTSHI